MPPAKRTYTYLAFVAGLFVVYLLGGVSTYYRHFPYSWLEEAVTAEHALHQKQAKLAKILARSNKQYRPRVTINKPSAYDGYTLIADENIPGAMLIDRQGREIHTWALEGPVGIHWRDAHAFPNGDLLVVEENSTVTPYGVDLIKLDKDSNLLWRTARRAHHTLSFTSEGHIVALSHQFSPSGLYPHLTSEGRTLLEDEVFMLNQDGKELESFSITEALNNSPYSALVPRPERLLSAKGRQWDITHTNSAMVLEPEMAKAFPMFKPGQVLVSMKNIKTIGVVDVDKRSFVWAVKLGNRGQHDAEFQPDGTILMLSNNYRPGVSAVLKFDPQTLEATPIYAGSARAPFHTNILGAMQVLPNGHLQIVESQKHRSFEVDLATKEIVWEMRVNVDAGDMGHIGLTTANRYAPDYFTFLPQ